MNYKDTIIKLSNEETLFYLKNIGGCGSCPSPEYAEEGDIFYLNLFTGCIHLDKEEEEIKNKRRFQYAKDKAEKYKKPFALVIFEELKQGIKNYNNLLYKMKGEFI